VNVAPAASAPWTKGLNPLGLTNLEVASGVVLGPMSCEPFPEADTDPLQALYTEARKILDRGRCVVAFSGGRDSSAVLSVLLHVARREGFEDPLALTARWPGDTASDESAWQEHVARELDLRRWEIVTPGGDVDLLGPVTTDLLRRHGLLWPAPVAVLLPLLEAVGDGILVTGEGGDEVFGVWSLANPWSQLRSGRNVRRSLRSLVSATLPSTLRQRRALATAMPYQDWLTSLGTAFYRPALAAEMVSVGPLWWPDYLREVHAERGLRLSAQTLALLCAERGASFAAPLLAPSFLAALARGGGRLGYGDRTATMRSVFSPLLSDAILSRVSKANFGGVFWGEATRRFARKWNGEGLDHDLVDVARLQAVWLGPAPVYGAALPLHAAWLASSGQSLGWEEPPGVSAP